MGRVRARDRQHRQHPGQARDWSEQARFKEHNEKLVGETQKLLAAAKTNNLDNLRAAFRPTAAACKSCHDDFRNK